MSLFPIPSFRKDRSHSIAIGIMPHMPSHNLRLSNCVVMKVEVDVSRASPVVPHEFCVARRPLVLGIARQHALQAYAYALYVVYRAPGCSVEKVKTDYAIRVDVRVHGDWVCSVFEENDFGCFCIVIC